MASKLEIMFKTTFGGTWIGEHGYVYNHPGKLWNWIRFTIYRIRKFILLKWYSVCIWYYKRKIR